MGWEVLVIPIIGVAVWIISTLLRSAEEAKRAAPPARKKGEKATDLDRFLREVQRRREAAEREEQRPRHEQREGEDRARRQRPRRTPAREEAIPVVAAVEVVPVAQPVVAAPPVALAEQSPAPPRRRPPAPAGLREVLRDRDAVRKAMILREILGPPLARRRAP